MCVSLNKSAKIEILSRHWRVVRTGEYGPQPTCCTSASSCTAYEVLSYGEKHQVMLGSGCLVPVAGQAHLFLQSTQEVIVAVGLRQQLAPQRWILERPLPVTASLSW